MGSVSNPKIWVPYVNTKDCSQGFCSLYCPQWCYMMSTPPPPPFVYPEDNSGPTFSPLVIAIIGILASAFLLVSYYAIISKYCGGRTSSSRRRENHHVQDEEMEENPDTPNHEPWHVSNNGLDESLIKSITVCKYKKGEGLIEFTDCSVCLGEFQEDERLRLLPKCSHAFHVNCIDTWLKSHSNCPLCRANIGFVNASPLLLLPPPPPPPIYDSDSDASVVPPPPPPPHIFYDSDTEYSSPVSEWHELRALNSPSHMDTDTDRSNANAASSEISVRDEYIAPRRVMSDLRNPTSGDAVIDIRDDRVEELHIRRSVSMDYSCEARVSMADVLFVNQEDELQGMEESHFHGEVGTSKRRGVEGMSKHRNRNRVLQCVMSRPMAMKRSFSCGRLLLSRRWRGVNLGTPL